MGTMDATVTVTIFSGRHGVVTPANESRVNGLYYERVPTDDQLPDTSKISYRCRSSPVYEKHDGTHYIYRDRRKKEKNRWYICDIRKDILYRSYPEWPDDRLLASASNGQLSASLEIQA